MESLINELIVNYPILTKLLICVAILRMIFKPLMTAIEHKVNLTEDRADDMKFRKFRESNIYLVLSFILDLSTSIKLPKNKM
jgi:hypothetical protein